MRRVVGIDHLVLSVGDFTRFKALYDKLLKFLGFRLKHECDDMVGWSNGKTLFWIVAAEGMIWSPQPHKGVARTTASRKHKPPAPRSGRGA